MIGEAPPIVKRLYNRWRKRVFANDNIVCKPSGYGEGYWDLIITRGKKEATLTISPNAYSVHNFILKADDTMRFTLKSMTEK